MTTRVEADHMTTRGGIPRTFHSREVIEGTESRDTTRMVTLFTTAELHPHTVYLHIFNHEDHASVVLDQKNKPEDMPDLHASLDDVPVDPAQFDHYFNDVKVGEGQAFKVWFRGETFEERDTNFGSAQFTWENPSAT